MALKILARIPADNGKKIRCDATYTHVVAPETCHVCECTPPNPATVVVQGATDSFGMELVAYCDACLAAAAGEVRSYETAADVADRAGHFVVSEMTNVDGYGYYFGRFTSFRAAAAYLRRCEAAAAPYSGLYPNKGVREMTAAEADAMVERNRQAEKADRDEWLAGPDDDFYDEPEDDWYDADEAAFDRSRYNI